MVELRKRKSTTNVDPTPAKKSTAKPKAAKAAAAPAEPKPQDEPSAAGAEAKAEEPAPASKGIATGDQLTIDGFGGQFGLTDGAAADKTTLQALLDKAETGVILFTYPKASTPGCKIPSVLPVRRGHPRANPSHRHQAGLSLPRQPRRPHQDRLRHLRPLPRLGQGQHLVQGEAEPAVHADLRRVR